MDEVLVKESYNKFEQYPLFSYNCVSYLINDSHSELLWKLLYYNDPNAWKSDDQHPDLTKNQKGALIYAGQQNQEDFRVFLDMGMDNAWTQEACMIRISPYQVYPTRKPIGLVTMAFEVYCHFKLNTLSNYQTRIDTVTQLIISALNGQNIEGIGRLFFDLGASRQCRSILVGQIPFRGRRTIMCNWAV